MTRKNRRHRDTISSFKTKEQPSQKDCETYAKALHAEEHFLNAYDAAKSGLKLFPKSILLMRRKKALNNSVGFYLKLVMWFTEPILHMEVSRAQLQKNQASRLMIPQSFSTRIFRVKARVKSRLRNQLVYWQACRKKLEYKL